MQTWSNNNYLLSGDGLYISPRATAIITLRLDDAQTFYLVDEKFSKGKGPPN